MEEEVLSVKNLVFQNEYVLKNTFAVPKKKMGIMSKQDMQLISFDVKSSEILGIISLSSSIKNKIVNILTGFDQAYSGNVAINGKKIVDFGFSNIGVVSSNLSYDVNLTLKDNLKFLAQIKKLPSERVDNVLEMLNIQSFANMKIKKLLPNLQRTALFAQALINNPDILIISDIFNFLSTGDIDKMWELLLKLSKEYHLAIIVIFDKIVNYTFMTDKLLVLTDKQNHLIECPTTMVKHYKNLEYKILTNKPDDAFNIINTMGIKCEIANKKIGFMCDENTFSTIVKNLAFAGVALLKSEQKPMNISKFCAFAVNKLTEAESDLINDALITQDIANDTMVEAKEEDFSDNRILLEISNQNEQAPDNVGLKEGENE